MLRIHLLQQYFGHTDPAMEEALHDIPPYRQFAHLDAAISRLPDESAILRFRHLLQAYELAVQILTGVNARLMARGLMLKSGAVMDSTLIAVASPTKNKDGHRDPEMHQTTKSKQRHFETVRARMRAKDEHPFRVIKCQFGHRKVRYKGLTKNTGQLPVVFALSRLWMVRKRLLSMGAQG